LLIVFSIRSPTIAAWQLPPNNWLYASVIASTAFLATAIYLPLAHEPFATVSLGLWPAITAIALAAAPPVLVELVKLRTRRGRNATPPTTARQRALSSSWQSIAY
jgi:hypothetical protein